MDLSRFRYGSKWAECINKAWLKELEEREKGMVGRLEQEDSCIPLSTITISPCIYIFHSHELVSWTAAHSTFVETQ